MKSSRDRFLATKSDFLWNSLIYHVLRLMTTFWVNSTAVQYALLMSMMEPRIMKPSPSNCIGGKELSHVHIKPHAMTRAMAFDKGLPESEVAY